MFIFARRPSLSSDYYTCVLMQRASLSELTFPQAIKAAGLPLPALNQISYHLYHSVSERALLAYCIANK